MLEIKNLSVSFNQSKALDGVSLKINSGEIVGLVGESGAGKSTLAHAVLGLLLFPGKITSGEILFQGKMQIVRGKEIAMVFQDPFTSLNPVLTIGDQIIETIIFHQNISRSEAEKKAIESLEKAHIRNARQRLKDYPHQFSGGMLQRVMLAIALSLDPRLLILDEPTTALDATIQKAILDLIKGLQKKLGFAVLLVSHDFSVINYMCNRVYVMCQGKIEEQGVPQQVFSSPQKAYTKKLVESLKILRGPNAFS